MPRPLGRLLDQRLPVSLSSLRNHCGPVRPCASAVLCCRQIGLQEVPQATKRVEQPGWANPCLALSPRWHVAWGHFLPIALARCLLPAESGSSLTVRCSSQYPLEPSRCPWCHGLPASRSSLSRHRTTVQFDQAYPFSALPMLRRHVTVAKYDQTTHSQRPVPRRKFGRPRS